MSHDFKKKHFSSPTWCEFCQKFIWGLGKQGYACTECQYPAHPKCYPKVTGTCTKKPITKTEPPADKVKEASSRKKQHDEEDCHLPEVAEVAPESQSSASASAPAPASTSQSSNKNFDECYTIGRELGRGAFSVVYEVKRKDGTGDKLAAKLINKKTVKQDLARLQIEIDILKSVDHPAIIKLFEVFDSEESLYIITEMATGGELFDRIVGKGSYKEKDAAFLIKQLVEALAYLHTKDIVHRDLKPENLLLKSKDDDTIIKLADFGLSKIVGQEVMMQTACGTPGYVAPEVLKAQGYGKEVDMWSVGVITYILLCGFPPFYQDNIPLLFESIMTADYDYPAEYWDHISDSAIDFIDSLLVVNPKKRMTAEQALQHKWLTNAPDTELKNVTKEMKKYNDAYKETSRTNLPSNADD